MKEPLGSAVRLSQAGRFLVVPPRAILEDFVLRPYQVSDDVPLPYIIPHFASYATEHE